jgi:hypothetical protein
MRQSPTRLPFRGRAVSHSFFVNSEVKRQADYRNLRFHEEVKGLMQKKSRRLPIFSVMIQSFPTS